MSLRTKIIVLFVVFAIAPLLLLAGVSYWQVRRLLEGAVGAQLQEKAEIAGKEVLAARAGIQAALEELTKAWASSGDQGLARESSLPPSRLHPALEGAEYVRTDVVQADGDRTSRILAGAVPLREERCEGHSASRIAEIAVEGSPDQGAVALTAGVWASGLLSPESKSGDPLIMLVDPGTEEILYSGQCETLDEPVRALVAFHLGDLSLAEGTSGKFRLKGGADRLGAFARVRDSGWIVLSSSSPASVLGSLGHLVRLYWLFVLALGLSTSLAFSFLIGHFTRSLRELSRAAEEIGTGELEPWLPLTSSDEIGQVTLAFNRMLERIRRMMAQVDQNGRLAVVGQLSAYLAHEIRNPLSSIKLNLQRLRRWTRKGVLPEFCSEPLEISLREVERLNTSVTGVLQLSKAEDSPREVVSLHDLLEEAVDLLSGRFKRQGVELELDLDAEADCITARPGQVKSLILNLMVNALEAQPKGGRLEIRSELSRSYEDGGPVVALHFKDEGGGVPNPIRNRIFEPFFTTKPGGSGIGLAMALQAARDNNGEIYLEPAFLPGTGAEFTVAFPLGAMASAPAGASGEPPSAWEAFSPRWGAALRKVKARDGSPVKSVAPVRPRESEGLENTLPPPPTDPGE